MLEEEIKVKLKSDLPWHIIVSLEKQFHELKQEEFGKARKGKKVGWSLKETADELNISLGTLSQDIRLAEVIELDESLKRVIDKKTALDIMINSFKRTSAELSASNPVMVEYNTIIHGESSTVLKSYPNEIFDVCITKPICIYKNGNFIKDSNIDNILKEIFRVLKTDSFIYMYCISIQDWSTYSIILKSLGFKIQKYPLIWVVEDSTSQNRTGWQYNRNYEIILIAVKGTPALTSNSLSSIYSAKSYKEVVKKIIYECSYEGSMVLDPFAGTGIVGECCKESNRKFILIDKSYRNVNECKKRVGL